MPILTYKTSNPMIDGRQSNLALMIQRGTTRFFLQNDIALLPELTLGNCRRADLVGIDSKGKITLIEIKSSVEDFKVDQKWPEYRDYCDFFYFASHKGVPEDIFPPEEGFILADNYGAEIIREAKEEKMPAASRKTLTLRFARTSASRLDKVIRFAQNSGITLPENLADINNLDIR